MYSRAKLLTKTEAKRYQVISISNFGRLPGLYFASLRAAGLPDLTVRVEYKARRVLSGFYSQVEIREQYIGVVKVRNDVEDTLGDKVKNVLETFKDIDYEAIKKKKEIT